jgi:hypothetical protein
VHIEVKITLKPGQNGTKRLVEQYGDQLICVRYRYDKVKRKRYKTIELIIDEQHGSKATGCSRTWCPDTNRWVQSW